MKLLAIGDLHLGRRPSRLPPEFRDLPGGLAPGPPAAWALAVEEAIRQGVDAVVLAGDVVEREDDFFEAFRHLQDGVAKLVRAGIPVFGVAGNHDVHALPRLAGQIPEFRLLGASGGWERASIHAGGEQLTLWGRSFTADRMREPPLEGITFQRQPGINLGVLHCDLDQRDSPYAPVMRSALEAAGLDGWLLGHIHLPSALTAPNPLGYLGSITGLDPGESGARGPWLITMQGGRITDVSQWELAPLRWERMAVDLTGIADPAAARERVLERVRDLDGKLAAGKWPPRAAGLRIRFTGRSRFGEAAAGIFSEDDRAHLFTGTAGSRYFIEKVENAARPEIALEELAERRDPPALLAARLLLLDRDEADPARQRLLAEGRRVLNARLRDVRWAAVERTPSDAEVESYLRRSAIAALEKLLAQKEAGE